MIEPVPALSSVVLSARRPARLIVNADDLGISERVNAGIAKGHREGIITAASLMATGRAFEDAVGWCRALPGLDVGVHLCAVAERPLLKRPSSLTGADGRFPADAARLARAWFSGRIAREDVMAEWSAQLEKVLAEGLRVTHLDSHQHVHLLPGLDTLTRELAERYAIPFVRLPIEAARHLRFRSGRDLKRLAGSLALRCVWGLARLAGGRPHQATPLDFLGFHDGGRLDETRLLRLLANLRPGRTYELMCHPGHQPVEPELAAWRYGHEEELRTLTSPVVRAFIEAEGIALSSFGLAATQR